MKLTRSYKSISERGQRCNRSYVLCGCNVHHEYTHRFSSSFQLDCATMWDDLCASVCGLLCVRANVCSVRNGNEQMLKKNIEKNHQHHNIMNTHTYARAHSYIYNCVCLKGFFSTLKFTDSIWLNCSPKHWIADRCVRPFKYGILKCMVGWIFMFGKFKS